jgi:hypothetical protein
LVLFSGFVTVQVNRTLLQYSHDPVDPDECHYTGNTIPQGKSNKYTR